MVVEKPFTFNESVQNLKKEVKKFVCERQTQKEGNHFSNIQEK